MSEQQPEALRLADALQFARCQDDVCIAAEPAAAELRRLHALNVDLLKAAKEVISWTEVTHRPPVRDIFEHGRMVRVRLHALVDLNDAIAKAEDPAS